MLSQHVAVRNTTIHMGELKPKLNPSHPHVQRINRLPIGVDHKLETLFLHTTLTFYLNKLTIFNFFRFLSPTAGSFGLGADLFLAKRATSAYTGPICGSIPVVEIQSYLSQNVIKSKMSTLLATKRYLKQVPTEMNVYVTIN